MKIGEIATVLIIIILLLLALAMELLHEESELERCVELGGAWIEERGVCITQEDVDMWVMANGILR